MYRALKMSVKHIFIQTCQFVVILNFTHTYVLFAANLDDFRSIAKKFIPNKLADQLTNMAAQNSMKYRQQNKPVDNIKADSETYEYIDETTKAVTNSIQRLKTTPKKRFAIKDHDIDFDELVDRVREQLERKSKDKQQKDPIKEEHSDYNEDDANTKEFDSKHVDQIDIPNAKTTKNYTINTETTLNVYTKTTTENTQYYDDEVEAPVPENDGMYFKEADLTKTNDSYEDYVVPEKGPVFESDETKTTKMQRVPSEQESRYKVQRLKAVEKEKEDEDIEYPEHKSEEVKAKTDSLSDEKTGKPRKLKGTMIPTREYYKLSSPNYYAKPAVAEKYDFNEPLPERDREPENLKYFGNPPASINKKVKLSR